LTALRCRLARAGAAAGRVRAAEIAERGYRQGEYREKRNGMALKRLKSHEAAKSPTSLSAQIGGKAQRKRNRRLRFRFAGFRFVSPAQPAG
jgi:hypothetical protein